MRRVREFFARARVAVGEERRLAFGLPVVSAATALVMGTPENLQKKLFGPGAGAIFLVVDIVLLAVCAFLFMWFFIRVGMRLRPPDDPVPKPQKSDFHCRILDTIDEARNLNLNLVPRVFPTSVLPLQEVLKAQEINPRRLCALVETRTGNVVGWSSLWPVTVTAGREIECGRRADEGLTAKDLLPMSRNGTARYVVALSFAVLPEYRWGGRECLALKLGSFVIGHIIEEFLRTTGRSIRFVAVAYTPEGRRLCRHLGLQANGHFADYGPGAGKKPLFAGDVTIATLTRRLAGGPAT